MTFFLQTGEQVEPGAVRHPIVGDDQVELLPANGPDGLVHTIGKDRRMTEFVQRRLEDDPNGRFVIDAENGGHAPRILAQGLQRKCR